MSELGPSSYSVLIWVTGGTWQAYVDAARLFAPTGAQITLMYVVPADLLQVTHGAHLGLTRRIGLGCAVGAAVAVQLPGGRRERAPCGPADGRARKPRGPLRGGGGLARGVQPGFALRRGSAAVQLLAERGPQLALSGKGRRHRPAELAEQVTAEQVVA
jgi:hypothetical protein